MTRRYCWIIGVTTQGRLVPLREKLATARREERKYFFDYDECVTEAQRHQVIRDNSNELKAPQQ